MHQSQEKHKSIPWKYNPRSIEWNYQSSFNKYFKNNNGPSFITIQKEHGVLSRHTKRCEIISRKNLTSNEPVSYTTLKYRHQHQQHILKQLRQRLQRFSSQYTITSQSLSKSSSPANISTTNFFHLIFSGWNKKPNKLSTRLQSKPKFSSTSCTRSIIGELYHQNKNSAEKPAGKLLRWSSSIRGGSIEKKQFDREYRFLRSSDCIKRKQQQQQRTQQVKHIELLLYNAFVKNTLTTRKH